MEYGFDDVVQRVAYKLGEGYTAYASLGVKEQTLVTSIINSGYNLFVRPPLLQGMRRVHEWSFLKPIATINIWPSVSTTLDGAPTRDGTSTLSGAHAATTTVTVNDAIFASWMVGETITIDTGGTPVTRTISSVTSTTVCEVDSAITESGGEVVLVEVSTVTVDDATFYDNMADGDETLTIGSNTYTITGVSSTLICYVSGDASGEVDEAVTSVTQDGAYRLPSDYGAMIGPMTHAAESGYQAVNIRSDTEIRRLRRWSTGPGITTLAAIRPLTPSQTATQEFDLLVYPAPDTNYPLTYRYSVRLSEFDDTTNKVFPGAADHSELILQACLAVAEERTQDGRGAEYQAFMTDLAPAILFDREAHAAESYGVPGGREAHSGMLHAEDIQVTVQGVLR